MTYQVEMEFKKHRQDAMLESFNALKAPPSIPRPGMFSDAKLIKAIQNDIKNTERRIYALKVRLKRALSEPAIHDPVYKVCQRCFHKADEITLRRGTKQARFFRRSAFKRFLIGCPPRKKSDTSIGDAVNWEWIVDCAVRKKAEIHLVSRDSDYGTIFDGVPYLNDHLFQEFKDRVSMRRRIQLHTKLSEALKLFAIDISPEEETEEVEVLQKPDQAQQDESEWLKLFLEQISRATLTRKEESKD